MGRPLFGKKESDEGSWVSVSDLMAGLMIVFLFILILYARIANERLESAQDVVDEWRKSEAQIYQALHDEFRDDLDEWDAEIDNKSLTVRFRSPEILFDEGKATLKPKFENILDEFMPRYIGLIASRFDDKVDEVRIEGHTSSGYFETPSEMKAFTENMKLSQNRTRAVLEYSLKNKDLGHLRPWMYKKVSANGLSSSRLILQEDGKENKTQSRRVEFKIRTKSKEALFDFMKKIAPTQERASK